MIVNSDAVLFVSTYPPRECGIATFTRNLADAIERKFFPYLKTRILAMNNNGVNIYNYPNKVMYQLSDTEKKDYAKLAEKINSEDSIKLVSIQHEFGIFGGEKHLGEYLIDFLKHLTKPKIITFHSILPNPEEERKKVVKQIAENVDEIIVMTPKGVEILQKEYGIATKIKVIPHGIPTVEYEKQDNIKKSMGYEGKIVLSSFGMISRGKGYEYVIDALPEVVQKFPNLLYIIVGATHPNIRKEEGERYRNFLSRKIKKLGLENNVKFYNKYVQVKEIIHFLKASDLYISPSLTPEQITSGTLAYAMGCGRVVVSTPFLHAKDMVSEDRGFLVEQFRNTKSFKEALLAALSDMNRIKNMEQNSYEFTRSMTWPNVALSYGDIIKQYIAVPEIFFEKLPEIKINHMRRMTDNFGMIQFAKYSTPVVSSGYTLDDNARALVVASKLYARTKNRKFLSLIKTYLNCLRYVQDEDGHFLNLVKKDLSVDSNSWSEEAHGRAIQSLGEICVEQSIPFEIRKEAEEMLLRATQVSGEVHAPRAASSIIAGLYHYNKDHYSESIINTIKKFADSLVQSYEENSEDKWKWFEKELTYSNSRLCEALLYSYMVTRESKYLDIALSSLGFLIDKTFEENIFIPIGQNGWYKKGGARAYFDQQPIDASSMVQTLSLAYKVTRNPDYEKYAISAFQWFLGKNTLKRVIYDEKTGGCYDGLDKEAANLNQGAEATLSYLSARLVMEELA